MNKCEKYFWKCGIKDSFWGASFLLNQSMKHFLFELFKSFRVKWTNKCSHSRVMNFMGIYK